MINERLIAVFFVSVATVIAPIAKPRQSASRDSVEIKTLSAEPARVTGGDVLLQVTLPAGVRVENIEVRADNRDLTKLFRKTSPNVLVGLATGLNKGKNKISVNMSGKPAAALEIVNYPITGPVFSGPWIEPFICQTERFKLPDGSTLGPPIDANCSAHTVVKYVYRTTDTPTVFKPLPSTTMLPPDVAKTTTTAGVTVNFIVRLETGTMDRGIYQNAILFDPTSDPPPTPFTPSKGWNRRLIAVHGVGCPSGWYIQGAAEGVDPLNADRLGEGYALFTNTLNHPTNSCNAVVAAEATMMGKEHFIETFGVPFYTISVGTSGGAYTSLQIADSFPGLFDGININLTFPDALTIALTGIDSRLLMHYFTVVNPSALTETQKVAISGYAGMKALLDAANQAQRTDPVPNRSDLEGYQSARWNDAVPQSLRYDPEKNPRGARPTVFDVARNIYGANPATGAAYRPFDNVGMQYGLNALNQGVLTATQFLDLNERIGGVDSDANYTATRTAGDLIAIRRAYESGLLMGGNGGLGSIPIFDNATTNEQSGYHYGWFHFAVRDRLRQANGNSDNMVMWRSTTPQAAQAVFDKWMVAYMSDTSNEPRRVKVIRDKPAEAVEGCFDQSSPVRFLTESLIFTSKPNTKCSALYPVYSNPRHEAGGPLAANVLKCQLKPLDQNDYRVKFDSEQWSRLQQIFPQGVCDFSKPGVNQKSVIPWASWGPSPDALR